MSEPLANFHTTRWSLVLAAGQQTPQSRQALESLCQTYWYPLFAFARRGGHSTHQAEDLVQGFLIDLLQRQSLEVADPQRGRFRSFLLTSFKNFMTNESHKERALKRGGDRKRLPLNEQELESRFQRVPSSSQDPERAYLRDWAHSLLDRVLATVLESYQNRGRAELFERLKPSLTSDSVESLETLAKDLDMSYGAIKVAIHRLRQRYHDAVRQEIRETLPEGEDLQEEIQSLFEALSP